MGDHQYFTVEGTALTVTKPGALAIYCGDAPRKKADGRKSFPLRAPLLILPPDLFDDGEEEIRKVAQLLNANAHLFFSSAAKPVAAPEVLALVEALRPFADGAMHLHPAIPNDATTLDGINAGEWRAARTALAKWEAANA